MHYNYYIDENGNYFEKPADQNPWKSGYTRYGFNMVKKYRSKLKKRRMKWQKIKEKIIHLFSWKGKL